MSEGGAVIWQTDEACAEAREEVLDRVYTLGLFTAKGRHADINDALDAYARAVAVAVLRQAANASYGRDYDDERGTEHGPQVVEVSYINAMLAELGGAE